MYAGSGISSRINMDELVELGRFGKGISVGTILRHGLPLVTLNGIQNSLDNIFYVSVVSKCNTAYKDFKK